MKTVTALGAALLLLVAGSGCERSPPGIPAGTAAAEAADTVFVNGRIYTVDGSRSWAQAVGIADGRIVYVGTDSGAADWIDAGTRRIDLRGRMMMPAFQDVHVHPIGAGMEALACDLNDLATLDEYRDRVAECAARDPDASWISGGGWLMSVFGPGAMPRREILDELVPERPVYLTSADGHTGWANSRALAIAGIDRDTPDPPDGRIDRDADTGEPIGSLQEGAMSLVTEVMPEPTLEDRSAGLRYAVDLLNGYGITAIQDAIVFENDLRAYHAVQEQGDLDLRVVASLWWQRDQGNEQIATLKRLRQQYSRGRVRAGTVKIMQDGVMENFTAAMLEPYDVDGAPLGIPMVEPEALKSAVTALDAEGFQVHFHAIGDAAVRQCLDAVEAARDANGERGNRHHVSHLEIIDPADIPRFRELGVAANFQPLWAYADEYITELTIPFIGPERSRRLYPIGSVYRSGALLAFGSDWSVSTANPFPQLEVAVTRRNPDDAGDAAFLPEQRIALPEAIAAFTINAAWVNGLETETGSVEVGKAADLIVLDRNLFEIEPSALSETRVLLTLLGGEAVHGDPATL